MARFEGDIIYLGLVRIPGWPVANRTNMEKRFQELLVKLEKKLETFTGLGNMERMRAEVSEVRLSLDVLEQMVKKDGFADQPSEIAFFKLVKPRFYALIIVSVENYNFHSARPLGKGKKLRGYLQLQLEYISRQFSHDGFMYEYYRTGATELDELYFLRGVSFTGMVGADLPPLDPSFSTVGDYLFSKFIALERFRKILLGELGHPVVGSQVAVTSRKGKELKWTGDVSNLIEVLYGLSETRQLNGGQVDISDLVDVFEQVFQVNLSNYFQRFAKIKQRKLVSKTKFLEEMVAAVAKRIDDADAYVPSWAK